MEKFARPTILVIEDNPNDEEMTRSVLESGNVEVVVARTGLESIIAASHQPFQLMLLDLNLPDMHDPAWLIQALKGIQPECSVAILTGAITDQMRTILSKWAIAVLLKPLTASQVKDAFQTIAK